MYYFNVIFRRFLELFLLETLLSCIFTALFQFKVIPSVLGAVALILIIELILYFSLQIIMLRHCYIDMANDVLYLILNLISNLIFGIVNIIFLLLNNTVYTWFFGLFKFFSLTADTTIVLSAIVIHIIMIPLIFAAPFGIKNYEYSLKKENNYDF